MACGEPKFCTNCIEGIRKILGVNQTWEPPKFESPDTKPQFSETARVVCTKEILTKSLDNLIERLQEFKGEINDQNYHKFNIFVSEHRELEPIRDLGDVVGHFQKTPIYLDIRIADGRMEAAPRSESANV